MGHKLMETDIASSRELVSGDGNLGNGETALVVDDESHNRLLLNKLLTRIGFQVIEAEDGVQAVETFSAESPAIVFMDIFMPEMDGYEATRRIKSLCGDNFVPVIVLTALSDTDSLSRSVAMGGDDVMTKPFDINILLLKIHAMLRIRSLHRHLAAMYNQLRQEEQIAERVFQLAVTAGNVAPECLRTYMRSARVFNGDMILTAHAPNGGFHLMLGDFTGHGQVAAIGALPMADIFRSMAQQGFDGRDILATINSKLCEVLPEDLFLSACYAYVSYDMGHVVVFNCGLPDVLWVEEKSGHIKQRLPSRFLPLGIVQDFPGREEFYILFPAEGDELLLYSDGLIESANCEGELFGDDRLARVVTEGGTGRLFKNIVAELDGFCGDVEQQDDISFSVIPILPGLLAGDELNASKASEHVDEVPGNVDSSGEDASRLHLALQGRRLYRADPVPMLVNELQSLGLPDRCYAEVYTILRELYSNALEHGVLRLNSAFKTEAEGFVEYYAERERRLAGLVAGTVTVCASIKNHDRGGQVEICLKDSGVGFDYQAYMNAPMEQRALAGRGIVLLRNLCRSLEYTSPGNVVTAVYEWRGV